MREILFRGKENTKELLNKTWVYGGIVHQTDHYGKKCDRWFIIDGTETQDYDIGYEYEVDGDSVGQFTGFYCKNKTRIFEGDILKFPCANPTLKLKEDFVNYGIITEHTCEISFDKPQEAFGVVKFEDGQFIVSYTDFFGQKLYNKLIEIGPFSEVVGNIYDNPELIK